MLHNEINTYPMICKGVEARARTTEIERARLNVRMSWISHKLCSVVTQWPRRRFKKTDGEKGEQIREFSFGQSRERLVMRRRQSCSNKGSEDERAKLDHG
jgi:hypothetical protein